MNIPSSYVSLGGWCCASPAEVVMLCADINYTQVYLANGKKRLVATTLKVLEHRLSSCEEFIRVHKSYMVNVHHVKNYRRTEDGLQIYMGNNRCVLVSRRKKKDFVEKMKCVSKYD
jgi:DNA-binding LytR/AlgR family response regulator